MFYLRLLFLICFFGLRTSFAANFNVANGDIAGLINAINQATSNGHLSNTINLAPNGLYLLTAVHFNFSEEGVNYGPVGLPLVGVRPTGGNSAIRSFTINGNGATIRRVLGSPYFRIMHLSNRHNFFINDLNIENGETDFPGAGIHTGWSSLVEVKNCKFINNRTYSITPRGGGAIMTRSSNNLIVTDSEFINNAAETRGAGLCVLLSDLQVSNSVFKDNNILNFSPLTHADTISAGGGIYVDGGRGDDGRVRIYKCLFEGNEGKEVGGGVYLYGYNRNIFEVEKCIFRNNKASTETGRGGGLWYSAGNDFIQNHPDYPYTGVPSTCKLTISQCVFNNNEVDRAGGGVFLGDRAWVDINNTTFTNNSASYFDARQGFGGAIRIATIITNINNCTFAYNHAATSGGALYGGNQFEVTLRNNIFAFNDAYNNGSGRNVKNHCQNNYAGSNNLEFPAPDPSSRWGDPVCAPGSLHADPRLGDLLDNGGFSFTMALDGNSPAINAGATTNCSKADQRGVIRTDRCDIGAYEYKLECCTQVSRFEAETNFVIVTDAPTNVIGQSSGVDMSAGRAVRLSNIGDVIRINFTAPEAGKYFLKARVRSGNNSNNANHFNGGYSFRLNGSNVNLVGNLASITGSSATGIYWGNMEAPVDLNAGNNSLTITVSKSWAFADFVEIGKFISAIPDTDAPTTPILSFVTKTTSTITLRWTKSQDNVAVIGYRVFLGNNLVASISDTSYTFNNLAQNTKYDFQVQAFDATDNYSAMSNRLEVKTNPLITNARYEAEDNYEVITDIMGQRMAVLGNTSFSNDAFLSMQDIGDKIRINFPIDVPGQYRLRVRVRSGSTSNSTNFWPNGYKFNVDGNVVTFNGLSGSISTLNTALNGSFWGTMEAGIFDFTYGNHYIEIETNRAWAGIDYFEVNYIQPTTSAQSELRPIAVAVDEVETAEITSVFPNPTNDNRVFVQLSGNIKGNIQYKIIDTMGKTVETGNQHLAEAQDKLMIEFKANHSQTNLYFIQLQGEKLKPSIVKIIRQ
jgi:predicted outer membrane repeat protein